MAVEESSLAVEESSLAVEETAALGSFAAVRGLLTSVGAEILAWRDDQTAKTLHSKADFKTEADRRAHQRLCQGLAALFPGVPVISEEDAEHAEARPRAYWLIDPIDGTASWYEGYPGFVTQVAYLEGETPIFGAIFAPAVGVDGRLWTARRGQGAYRDGAPITATAPADRLVVVDNYPEPRRAAKIVGEALAANGYLESGSLGLKAALVADGAADLFVKDVVVRDWDMAPAAALLAETGGALIRATGAPYRFAGAMEKPEGCVVARDGALAARAAAALSAAA